MGQRIIAYFTNLESCCDAEARLKAEGYGPVRQFSGSGGGQATSEAYQLPESVKHHGGEWTICIRPVFGRALRARQILETAGAATIREEPEQFQVNEGPEQFQVNADRPFEMRPDAEHAREHLPDRSFFVSSLLGIPLLFDCAAPLSTALHLPTLIRRP